MATYTIQSGDTLSAIARRHGTTVAALAALNGIADPNRIYAGRTLRLPSVNTAPSTQTAVEPLVIDVVGGQVQRPLPPAPTVGKFEGFLRNLGPQAYAVLAVAAVFLAVALIHQPEPRKRGNR